MYYVYTAVILRTIYVRSRAVCSTVVYGESTVLDNSSFGQIDMAAVPRNVPHDNVHVPLKDNVQELFRIIPPVSIKDNAAWKGKV